MEILCVDRIINGIAVCEKEDFTVVEIKVSEIPFEIYEGSIIRTDGKNYFLDTDEEQKRRKKIIELQNKLKNKR